jgi:hypothetical protein
MGEARMMGVTLVVLEQTFAVCRLDPAAPFPSWAQQSFVSITRTREELSIVCEQRLVPNDVEAERDWRCLGVVGPLPFALTGVLLSLAQPLAERGISIFAVSTFDTDYLLIKASNLEPAIASLRDTGHMVE